MIVCVLIEIIEDHGASHIWCVSAHTLVSLLGVAILRLLCRCWGFTVYVGDGFQVGADSLNIVFCRWRLGFFCQGINMQHVLM